MKYGVFSANEFVYTDTDPEQGKRKITLLAAQNSFACAQIYCKELECLSVEWIPVEGAEAVAMELNRLIAVYVDKNTSEDFDMVLPQGTVVDYVAHLAPFYVFDAMEPVALPANLQTQDDRLALYLRFPTAGLPAGTYSGTVKLQTIYETVEIPVSLEIAAVAVPEKETLRVTNWFNIEGMATYHGVEPWSEEHWKMIEAYGRMMRAGRQTDFWIPRQMLEYSREKNGMYRFNFSKIERLIRLYLSLGFRYIEGTILLHRIDWHSGEFWVRINEKNVPALTEEAYPFLYSYYTSWYAFLKQNGWDKITTQHVGDEPQIGAARDYRILAGMIHKWMPGVKIIEAVETTELDGAVDVWVPKSIHFETEREEYEKKRKYGDEFWYYTCCFPGGKYLNRLLDEELIRTRYLHWANELFDLTGYLHWGLNIYQAGSTPNPFATAMSWADDPERNPLPAGDTHILYPKEKQVLSSARFEMMRAGCEDYELLQLLKAKDPAAADAIVKRCVRSFTDYTTDVSAFEAAYRELLAQLAKLA